MGSEKDLTVVLDEAASLAAELAVEIGEPVPSAIGELRAASSTPASLETASDLDEQLANIQVLVDDAAASVDAPSANEASEADDSTGASAPVQATPEVATTEPPEGVVVGAPSNAESKSATTGVVGNMPSQPKLAPPPPPAKATPGESIPAAAETVSMGKRAQGRVHAVALMAADACARFLELIDEPFQFIGQRPRVAIGWLALATVGASTIVAILSQLL